MKNSWLAEHPKPESVERLRLAIATSERHADIRRYVGSTLLDDQGQVTDFAVWLCICNATLTKRFGIGIFDISDACWADFFGDDMAPHEGVRAALESDDLFSLYLEGQD